MLGLENPASELTLAKVQNDALGHTHLRFRQSYWGVPVFGAELIAQLDEQGDLTSISRRLRATPEKLALTPLLTADQAKLKAKIFTRYRQPHK